ncbi:MAG: pentapeptide repeat-containing protein, partial [Bacteroidota bacterium]
MRLFQLTIYVITLTMGLSSCSAQKNGGDHIQSARQLILRIKSGESVVIRNQTFEEDIDLTQAGELLVTAPQKGVVRIPGQLTFINCVFRGKLIGYRQDLREKSTEQDAMTTLDCLSGLSFIDCEFDDAVTLREATIRGGLICSRSEFAGEADFQGVRVLGAQCAFDGAVFYKNAKFQRLDVLPNANFVKATFNKQVDF